jgi:RNA polymerase sigma-70 factor, ECF subfamily
LELSTGCPRNTVESDMADIPHDPLERFRAGDREAFTVIYRVHSPAIFRFALHMTADRMKAADITQDVFVWLIHHAESFDPSRGELGAYLIGVARKFLLRQQRNDRQWLPYTEEPATPDPTDESQTIALRDAIAALPPRYREVVALCDLEGETYEAAASALQCAVGTVRSRLHRARQLLSRKLQTNKQVQRCQV